MNIGIFIEGTEVKISEDSQSSLNFDFSYDPNNPNANLLEELELDLIRSNDEFDGFNLIRAYKRSNPLQNPSIKIVDQTLSKSIFDGKILLNSSKMRTNDFAGLMTVICKSNYESLDSLFSTNLRSLELSEFGTGDVATVKQDPNPEATLAILLNTGFDLFNQGEALIDSQKDAVADTSGGLSGAIVTGLKIIILLARIALIVVQTALLFDALKKLISPSVKYFNCYNAIDLLRHSLEKVSYVLKDVLIDDRYRDLTILPATNELPTIRATDSINNAIPDWDLGTLFDYIRQQFNVTYKVVDNEITFANIDHFETLTNNYQLEDLQDNGSYYNNYSDLHKSVSFKYLTDESDPYTFQQSKQTGSIKTEANHKFISNNLQITNDLNINVDVALLPRKNKQSTLDEAFRKLVKSFRTFGEAMKFVGGKSSNGYDVTDTTKVGIISNDTISNDRVFLADGELLSLNSDLLFSQNVISNFYLTEHPYNRQKHIYEVEQEVRILDNTVETELRQKSNVIKDSKGDTILVTLSDYTPLNNTYRLEYRKKIPVSHEDYLS